ncbi:MAG: hypothetical protein PHD37_11425 [Gallionellaceae bacterium]|nr:hypothetical protein [Gallionellaceae bacterium]
MRVFLAILLRCALAFGLALAPVANALDMAAMGSGKEDMPSCHIPVQQQQTPDGQSGHAASQCHCVMVIGLPANAAVATHPGNQSDHPQTAQRLGLGLTAVPEIPPPQALS